MTDLAPLLLLLLACAPARAQEAWPPALPDFRRAAAPAAPSSGVRLQPGVLEQLTAKIAQKDFGGLGAEAARVETWRAGRDRVSLRESGGRWSLSDGKSSFGVTPAFASALSHADGYFGMTPATVAAPPASAEIAAAATSPAGVEAIARIFERTIVDRVVTPTGVVVPEAGGEAALDRGMVFHEIPDMTREILPRVAAAAHDEAELARLYAASPEPMKAIDENGLLANVIRLWPGWRARGMAPEKMQSVLTLTVDTVLRNTSDSYIFDPDSQFAAVVSQDWSGRYVGRWHTHPPARRASGWGGADIPSGPDMDIASKEGQNMVFVFQPDGFDFYDLSPMAGGAPELAKCLKTEYRSEAWRARFQALFESAFGKKP